VELPRLEELWMKYRNRGFSVIAMQADQERERASKIIEDGGLTFPLLQNEKGNDVMGGLFGINGHPTSFIMDREGRIMYCHEGFTKGDEAELEREILELLVR
jgi:peroxiredoxin